MKWIDCRDRHPVSEPYDDGFGTYYHVKFLGFVAPDVAMYLEDSDGNKDWWVSYVAKVAVPVEKWLDEEEPIEEVRCCD